MAKTPPRIAQETATADLRQLFAERFFHLGGRGRIGGTQPLHTPQLASDRAGYGVITQLASHLRTMIGIQPVREVVYRQEEIGDLSAPDRRFSLGARTAGVRIELFPQHHTALHPVKRARRMVEVRKNMRIIRSSFDELHPIQRGPAVEFGPIVVVDAEIAAPAERSAGRPEPIAHCCGTGKTPRRRSPFRRSAAYTPASGDAACRPDP